MSLPRELLDDLLSRYMDDQLSRDELQRVERLLEVDEVARGQFERLVEQRETLQRIFEGCEELAGRQLRPDFASRVFSAAIAEADRQGIGANHPLRLAQADRGVDSPGGRGRRLVYLGVLATAASLAAVAFVSWPRVDGPSPIALDQPDPAATGDGMPTSVPATSLAENGSAVEPGSEGETGMPSGDAVADDDGTRLAQDTGSAMVPGEAAVGESGRNSVPDSTQPDLSAVAEVDASLPVDGDEKFVDSDQGMVPLQAIFVYEVRLTQLGVENNVVGRLFGETGIDQPEVRDIDQAMVGFLQNQQLVSADAGSGAKANLLLLEGSAVKLDQLMLKFLETRGEVSQIGFSMVMNPPLMTAASNLQGDLQPTDIQPAAEGRQDQLTASRLVPKSDRTGDNRLPFVAGEHRFMALNRETLAGLGSLSASQGEQEPSMTAQVLVIVRSPE